MSSRKKQKQLVAADKLTPEQEAERLKEQDKRRDEQGRIQKLNLQIQRLESAALNLVHALNFEPPADGGPPNKNPLLLIQGVDLFAIASMRHRAEIFLKQLGIFEDLAVISSTNREAPNITPPPPNPWDRVKPPEDD